MGIRPYTLVVLIYLVLSSTRRAVAPTVSCNSGNDISWTYLLQSRCYKGSSKKLNFWAAKELCENKLSMHLLFLETQDERNTVLSIGSAPHEAWLGISQVSNSWYWTIFESDSGIPSQYTDWESSPDSYSHGVVNFNGKWRGVSPNEEHYVICERRGSTLPDFPPLPQSETTAGAITTAIPYALPTNPTPFTKICEGDRSEYSYRMESSLYRLSNGLVDSLIRSEVRSVVTCATYCLHADHCCFFGYSFSDKSCYRVKNQEVTSSVTGLNCSTIRCYRVKMGQA